MEARTASDIYEQLKKLRCQLGQRPLDLTRGQTRCANTGESAKAQHGTPSAVRIFP
jgi:hypothetical protein